MHSSQHECVLFCQYFFKKKLYICSDASGSAGSKGTESTPEDAQMIDRKSDPYVAGRLAHHLQRRPPSPLVPAPSPPEPSDSKLSVHRNQLLIHDISFALSQ